MSDERRIDFLRIRLEVLKFNHTRIKINHDCRFYILAILLFLAVYLPSGGAQAMKGADIFAKSGGLTCWGKSSDRNLKLKLYMCFHKSGIVYGMNSSQMEAMASLGYYKNRGNVIQIIGYPGSDWISALYGNMCQWSISNDGKLLRLEKFAKECDLAGTWDKLENPLDQSDLIKD